MLEEMVDPHINCHEAIALAGPPASIDARSSAKARTPLKVVMLVNRLTVKK